MPDAWLLDGLPTRPDLTRKDAGEAQASAPPPSPQPEDRLMTVLMTVELQHTDATLSEMPPLTWRWWSNGSDSLGGVVVMTDSCTTPVNDSPHHAFLNMQPNPWSIADDGTVTPSVHFLDCGWHEMVRLLDWSDDRRGTDA